MPEEVHGRLWRRGGVRPVARAVESCCARCEGQACHWCVCHVLDLEGDAGAVWIEARPSEGPGIGFTIVWAVEVRLECLEHGAQQVCALSEQPVTWS